MIGAAAIAFIHKGSGRRRSGIIMRTILPTVQWHVALD